MSNGLIKVLLFLIGVLVAVAVALTTRTSSTALARTGKSTHSKLIFEESAPQLAEQSESSPVAAPVKTERVVSLNRYREIERLTPEQRQSMLVQALREGTASSLPLVNARVISNLPEYRNQLVPVLEREALQTLLARFRQIDWLNWPLSSTALDGGPTEARSYIDLLHGENPEIGRFLETAAEMFYLLFRSTREGKVFSGQAELENFLQIAERGAADKSPAAVPERRYLDNQIMHNPAFVPVLDELRAQFVLRTLEKHSDDLMQSLTLLLSVPPGPHQQEIASSIRLLLLRFSLEASPKYRAQVFDVLHSSKYLQDWLEQEPVLHRPLAELYLVGAMDALEIEDIRRAALFLDESQNLAPGLKSQELLAEYLKSSGHGVAVPENAAEAPAVDAAAETKPAGSRKLLDSVTKDSETEPLLSDKTHAPQAKTNVRSALMSAISYISVFLFILLVVGGIVMIVLYRRSLSLTPAGSGAKPRRDRSSSNARMTPPGEMDFGEEFELGTKARQSGF